jgi:hypothetical protein
MKNFKMFFRTYPFFFFLLFFLLNLSPVSGKDLKKSSPKSFLSLGNIALYPRKVQIDIVGSTEDFNFNPYISYGQEYDWKKMFFIIPEVGLAFTGNGRHDAISRVSFFLLGDLAKKWKRLTFQTGLGIYWTLITGSGGTQTSNNGNSSTDFYLPEFTSISSNLTVNFGISYHIGELSKDKDLFFKIDSALYNLTNDNKRAISYRISLLYFFRPTLLNSYFFNKD